MKSCPFVVCDWLIDQRNVPPTKRQTLQILFKQSLTGRHIVHYMQSGSWRRRRRMRPSIVGLSWCRRRHLHTCGYMMDWLVADGAPIEPVMLSRRYAMAIRQVLFSGQTYKLQFILSHRCDSIKTQKKDSFDGPQKPFNVELIVLTPSLSPPTTWEFVIIITIIIIMVVVAAKSNTNWLMCRNL